MRRTVILLVLLALLSVAALAPALAAPSPAGAAPYSDYTPYEQLEDVLDGLVASSDRVAYEVIGQSAGGRDLYLVTVARPDVLAHLGDQLAFRRLMLDDPAAAQAQLQAGASVMTPLFINCSIHGNEPNGTDAGLRLLDRLAHADDAETMAILDRCVVLVNICQNPDGRVANTRANANGFDLNRDFLLTTQPETRATAAQVERWLPVQFLDLHGYYNPMLIEPCTPPHNPNYEYDLFIKWGVPVALAMRDAVKAATRHGVDIAYLDMKQGFEDYSPFYTPQFALYYGAVGQTLETFAKTDLGTTGHVAASWAGMLYVAQHARAVQFDQIEQFRRGVVGYQQDDITFPSAYVIPATAPLQRSPVQAARMVDQLIAAGIRVDRAKTAFVAPGPGGGTVAYPAGTYIVSLRQSLRGLANTWLWDGLDLSYVTNAMYSVCATSLPQLLGFDRVAVAAPLTVPTERVGGAAWPAGGVDGDGPQYVLANDGNGAVRAVNELMDEGASVEIVTEGDEDLATGDFLVTDVTEATLEEITAANHVVAVASDEEPVAAKALHPVKLGVYGTNDVRWVLTRLGFSVSAIGASSSLGGYDCVLGNRTALSATNVKSYVRAGGGYVGIGYNGTSGPLGNLLPVTLNVTNAYDNNAIVRARYRSDGVVSAGFRGDDYAFVYRPIWFTSVKAGAVVDAWYGAGHDWYVCGYWRDRAGARGAPAVVSGSYGAGKAVYIGFEPAMRGYPEGQYRLMANAIWYATE